MPERVAILLATYNGAKYINDFLDSLLKQTYKSFTIFFRDDGSSDNTIELINEYVDRLDIKIVPSHFRLGSALSFYELLSFVPSNYNYFFFADQDDWWLPSKIESGVSALSKIENNIPALYFTKLNIVDSKLNHIKYSRDPSIIKFSNALVQNIVTGCTLAINSSGRLLLLKNTPNLLLMHDWWSYLVISSIGVCIYDKNPLILYRQHNNNVVGASKNSLIETRNRVLRFLISRKSGVFKISDQAREFYRIYPHLIPAGFHGTINNLICPRKSLFTRTKLIIDKNLKRQTLIDNFLLKVCILLKQY